MTPVEKAQELYDKFEDVMIDADAYFVESGGYRAAIKAVDEILEDDMFDMGQQHFEARINYWEEVKHELEYMRTKHLPK
jgi:hypothetical protein